ncbi:HAD family hydrolase [Streptacidiphilus cavernicola]|uniref:HAD family hydrolase n=1 Tax=Streptacidiphilus cavernicola TaxID=3342716 RepID=A0ABV6VN17_9ACTN
MIRPPVPDAAPAVFHGVTHVLFDFDGPLVQLFAVHRAPGIAKGLLALILRQTPLTGEEFSDATDPHGMVAELRGVLERHPRRIPLQEAARVIEVVQRELVRQERIAAGTARVTADAVALVRKLLPHCGLAVTSNNAPEAIHDFLARDLAGPLREAFGHQVHGRAPDPDLMKPHPDCVRRALEGLGCTPDSRVLLIGDSESDFKAAAALGVRFLGFAPHARKEELLRASGVEDLVSGLDVLLWDGPG